MKLGLEKIILIMTVLLFGCAQAQEQKTISDDLETSFRELITIDDVIKHFTIFTNPSKNQNHQFGTEISIVMENRSAQTIYFPVGYGIRIFLVRDNEWVEIQNNDEYYGEGSFLRTQIEGGLGGSITTGVRPILPTWLEKGTRQEIIRIIFVGELMSEGEKNRDINRGIY